MKGRVVPVAASIAVLTMVACGGKRGVEAASPKVETAGISLPRQLLGLQVGAEDVSKKLALAKRPYIDSVGLFSFRENDLVRATFQVSRFNRLANPGSSSFRSSIIGLVGSSQPQQVRVGDTIVYVTTGNEQNIYVWFEGRGFFVLTSHREYEFPRTLLRRLLELNQKL